MQIRTPATPGESREAAALIKPKNFWLKFFLGNWYASAIAVLIIGADVNLLLHGKTPKWGPSLGLLAVCAFLFLFSWYRWRSKVSSLLEKATARVESLSLETDGVRVKLKSGTATFVPWSSYSKWSEGKSVFLLAGNDGSVIIPADDSNRNEIRGMLSSQIR